MRFSSTGGTPPAIYRRDPELSPPGPAGFDAVVVAPGRTLSDVTTRDEVELTVVPVVSRIVIDRQIPADAIHSFVVLHRRTDLDHEKFGRYWSEHHAPLVLGTSSIADHLAAYTQHRCLDTDAPGSIDGVAESAFASRDAMRSVFRSPDRAAVAQDELRFLDGPRCTVTLCRRQHH